VRGGDAALSKLLWDFLCRPISSQYYCSCKLRCFVCGVKVWAKRRFKTPEKYLRAKYKREFELNEKIVSNTLWARLEPNGRLVVGAVTKRQPPQPTQSSTSTTGTAPSTAAGSDRNVDTAAEITSFPPEAADAAQCPDILVTCPDRRDF